MTVPVAAGRTLPRGLAAIVGDLELEQPVLVTLHDLGTLAERHGVRTRPSELARRLRQRGWLLPTGRPGVFEFAPGAHAGPYGHGDPYMTLRAELLSRPRLPVAVALHSALWLHGLADRPPPRHEVALPTGVPAPKPLSRGCRVVRFQAQRPPADIQGVPVHQPPTMLVHLATRPSDVRSWSAFAEALLDLADRSPVEHLREELHGRPLSVRVRLAYLLQAVAPHLVADLDVPKDHGVIWFGPRGGLRRHDAQFQVADTVLPFDPSELSAGDSGPAR